MSKNPIIFYSFGMVMPERTFSSPVYRYGFNGQEKDDEVAGEGNINTAEYWEYDCRLGRRWNLDPILKTSLSPYLSFGDNPLKNQDHKGNKWDPENESSTRADQFRSKTESKLKDTKAEINSLNEQIKSLDTKSPQYSETLNNINEKLIIANGKLREFNSVIKELDILGKSKQVYSLKPEVQDPTLPIKTEGETRYSNGKIIMTYPQGDMQLEAHELEHAYQFEIGKTSFNKQTGNAGLLVDLTDERLAYRRQGAYANDPTLSNLSDKQIVNRSKKYEGFPSQPLDKNMSIEDVWKANYGEISTMPSKYINKKFDAYEEDIINR